MSVGEAHRAATAALIELIRSELDEPDELDGQIKFARVAALAHVGQTLSVWRPCAEGVDSTRAETVDALFGPGGPGDPARPEELEPALSEPLSRPLSDADKFQRVIREIVAIGAPVAEAQRRQLAAQELHILHTTRAQLSDDLKKAPERKKITQRIDAILNEGQPKLGAVAPISGEDPPLDNPLA